MPILLTCPACMTKLKAPESLAGRKIKCPKCGSPVAVPSGSEPRRPAAVEADRGAITRRPKEAPAPAVKAKRQADEEATTREPRRRTGTAKRRRDEADDFDELEIVRPGPGRSVESPAASWETSTLGRRERLLVCQSSVFQLKSFVYRDFDILDPVTKKRVGIASDCPGLLVQCLRVLNFGRFSMRNLLPTTLEVRENEEGPLLFGLRRAPQLLKWFVTVEIYDGAGGLIGYFRNKLLSLFGGFTVYDGEDQKVAELKLQMGLPPKFVFVTADGDSMGSIYPEGAREAIEQKKTTVVTTIGRRLGLDLRVSERMRDDPTARLLMLACVLAVQFSGVGGRFFQGMQRS